MNTEKSNAFVLKEIIQNRRSIFPKSYTPSPIEPSVLEEIVQSANFAPNHKRTRPWRYKLMQGEEKDRMGDRLAEIYRETVSPEAFLEKKFLDIADKWKKSGAVLIISVHFSGLVPEWEEIAAVAMGVQNMYLTATAHNVGCYWSTPGLKDHLFSDLNLRENERCLGFFFLGSQE